MEKQFTIYDRHDGVRSKYDNSELTVDDAAELIVERNLRDNIQEATNKGKELLPTQSGFFFGGTEYDEYYMEEIADTITMIEKIIEHKNTFAGKLYPEYCYRSSW